MGRRPEWSARARPLSASRVRWVFFRALGFTWLVAFTSLGRQVLGLYGRRGLAPLADRMELLRTRRDVRRYLRWPTLFWLDASDRTLVATCRAGQAASLLMLLNVAPRLTGALCWAGYVSFVAVGSPFLSYQWDALLLETGALGVVSAPSGLRPGLGRRPPSWPVVLAMRWLAFRLHFESGLAKLQSGDPTWRGLTACGFHQETQPLPTPVGWFVHHLPPRAHRASTAAVLFAETVVPSLALLPGPFRRAGFWGLAALQGAIALTGNYGFFNLLSATIALWLLDDAPLGRLGRPAAPGAPVDATGTPWRGALQALTLAPLWLSSVDELLSRFRPGLRPKWLAPVVETPRLAHLVSPYGLFSVMTTRRPEIVFEGSIDGQTWQEYGFRYKPGELRARPRFVAPHMPRLDWQLWFAALGRIEPWLVRLMKRLREGVPEVLALMGPDPFQGEPPKHVRALLYEYRTTSLEERKATGAWWRREYLGLLSGTDWPGHNPG